MIMDFFDIIGTVDPDVAWCIACLFILFFAGGFGCILLWIIAKHGRVVERKEALELKRRKWWEELR